MLSELVDSCEIIHPQLVDVNLPPQEFFAVFDSVVLDQGGQQDQQEDQQDSQADASALQDGSFGRDDVYINSRFRKPATF